MRDNSKSFGDVAEIVATAEYIKAGYTVSRPLTDNAPYDFIVDDGTSLKKVQVKGRKPKNGVILVELYCNARSYNGIYASTDFDVMAVVNMDTYGVASLDTVKDRLFESDSTYKTITLRIDPPKTSQTKGVKMFANYAITSPI